MGWIVETTIWLVPAMESEARRWTVHPCAPFDCTYALGHRDAPPGIADLATNPHAMGQAVSERWADVFIRHAPLYAGGTERRPLTIPKGA